MIMTLCILVCTRMHACMHAAISPTNLLATSTAIGKRCIQDRPKLYVMET